MNTMTMENQAEPRREEEIQKVAPNAMHEYVMKRYNESIAYYWKASGVNKRTYKRSRSLVIILGATVTLFSSLISASFLEDPPWLRTIFAIVTPALAALLTIISGFIQSFHSGAAWRDMTVNAERLEKERDRYLATPEKDRNHKRELGILNDIIVSESNAFFRRILDSEYKPDENNEQD